jgi:hypothetical protein
MPKCKWCDEGNAPVWSFDAHVWIHRRDTIDKRCLFPPNNYGYTTQVPEERISDEIRKGLRSKE